MGWWSPYSVCSHCSAAPACLRSATTARRGSAATALDGKQGSAPPLLHHRILCVVLETALLATVTVLHAAPPHHRGARRATTRIGVPAPRCLHRLQGNASLPHYSRVGVDAVSSPAAPAAELAVVAPAAEKACGGGN